MQLMTSSSFIELSTIVFVAVLTSSKWHITTLYDLLSMDTSLVHSSLKVGRRIAQARTKRRAFLSKESLLASECRPGWS